MRTWQQSGRSRRAPFAAPRALRHTERVPLRTTTASATSRRRPSPPATPRTRTHATARARRDPAASSSSATARPACTTTSGSRSRASSSAGPSPRARRSTRRIRRMAVHVEDHPIEYFDFEGVIPRSQYGAGDVIVWDWGTWEPEAETPDAGARRSRTASSSSPSRARSCAGRFTIVRTERPPRRRAAAGRSRTTASSGCSSTSATSTRRPGLGRRGLPAERQDRPHERRGQGRPRRDLDQPGARRRGRDRPVAAREGARCPASSSRCSRRSPTKAFNDPDWLFEIKWDGYPRRGGRPRRQRASSSRGTCKDAETYFPRLLSTADLDRRPARRSSTARSSRSTRTAAGLQPPPGADQRAAGGRAAHLGPLVYQAFDLLHLDGRSLLGRPARVRASGCCETVLREHPRVRFAVARRRRGAGLPSRRPQEQRPRGRSWPSFAARATSPAGGRTPGSRSRSGPSRSSSSAAGRRARATRGISARSSSATYEDGQLRFAGKVGSGFTGVTRERLLRATRAARQRRSAVRPAAAEDSRAAGAASSDVVWVRPELVIRAELGGWTRDGIVRQAAFKGIERGRDPTTVVRERPVETGAAVEAAEEPRQSDATADDARWRRSRRAEPKRRRREADGHAARPPVGRDERGARGARRARQGGRLARWRRARAQAHEPRQGPLRPPPRRTSDASEPVTKRELIRYFARIAPAMLPHLADRPLNLHRFPNGAGGPSFWQKDMPDTAPGWLRPLARDRRRGARGSQAERRTSRRPGRDAVLARQPGRLRGPRLDLANSTTRGSPTFALDRHRSRATKTTWDETVTLARLYRTALGHLGVRGYPKTHRQARHPGLDPDRAGKYTFRRRATGSRSVSRAVGATVPGPRLVGVGEGGSQGQARLDYTQNASIKTLVAPYAVRPAAGRAGVGADHLGGAGRPRPATEPLDDPRRRRAGRAGRRPVRGRPDRPAGAAEGLAGAAQSRATTPRTGSPVDCLPEPPIGTHTSFLLGWFGS